MGGPPSPGRDHDASATGHDLASQVQDVLVGHRSRSGQAEVHRIDPEIDHVVDRLDLLVEVVLFLRLFHLLLDVHIDPLVDVDLLNFDIEQIGERLRCSCYPMVAQQFRRLCTHFRSRVTQQLL